MNFMKKNNHMITKTVAGVSLVMLFLLSLAFVSAESTANHLNVDMLNQDPDPAEPGAYVELRWKIEKIGNDPLKDIEFELEVEHPFLFDKSGGPIQKISGWDSWSDDDEYYILYYKLKVDDYALEDVYDIDLKYSGTEEDGSRISIKKEFSIRVGEGENAELTVGSVLSDPTKILPDTEENELSIDIINVGDGEAENVVVELIVSDGFENSYSYSLRDSLGNIASSESATATFYLDVGEEVVAGAHDAKLAIKYKEEGSDENELLELFLPFLIEVKEKPTFEIKDVVYSSETVEKGDSLELTFTIENAGSKKVESVSLRAFKESTQPFDFDKKTDFIGTIEPGDVGTAKIVLDVDEDAENKKYLVDFEIRSVRNGQVFIQEETIPVIVETTEKGFTQSPIFQFLVVLVIAVVLIGGAYVYGKGATLRKN